MPSITYEFPYASKKLPVFAANVVASSQHLAATAGLRMMARGGNAVDAAIASAIAITVVEPTMNGIGADAFCILWDGQKLVGLNASGHSPALMTPDQFKGQDKMPNVGWGSVTTPGAVSLWMELHKRYGKLPFADLFEPGIKYAHDGFRVSYMVAKQWDRAIDRLKGQESWVKAFLPNGRAPQPEVLVRELGKTYEIMNTNIKRWSVGSPIQAPLDALLDLIREHKIKADDVVKLVVRVSHQGANTVNNRHMPDICMQHMCAVMLIDSFVTFKSSHDEKRMQNKKVLDLRSRIELYGDDELTRVMPSRQGIVELKLRNGRELRLHTKAVRGTSDSPMSRAEVDDKSYDLLAPVLGKTRARKLCDSVWNIEKLTDARTLRPLLQA